MLGGAWRSIQTWRNLHSTSFNSDIRGYHVFKDVWKTALGEILHAEQELDNAVDKFAAKVVKKNETDGHLLCEYSQILWYLIIASGGRNC